MPPRPRPPLSSRPRSSAATSGLDDVLIEITYAGVCHSDIHTVRGEWGAIAYPQVVGHEIVGFVTEVGAERHQARGRRPRRRRLHGQLVPRVRELPGRRGAVLPRGQHRHLHGVDRDGTITQGGYSTHIVVDRGLRAARARVDPVRGAPLRCCARASPRTRRCATGTPARARRSPSSAWAGSATWASRSPTRWAPR